MKKRILTIFLILTLVSFVFAKEYDAIYGNFRINMNDTAGTYCLYVMDPISENFVPVLNPLNNSSKNKLYLKSGNRVYPLSKQDGVSATHEFYQTGASISYVVKNVAVVKVMFNFVNSKTGNLEDADLAIVDILVQNNAKVSKNVAVKAVFDTVLGESYIHHFSTSKIDGISTEAVFNSMESDKWIKSANDNISLKFLFDGQTISSPSNVSLANINLLSTDNWENKMVPGRGFSSLFSINNSAVSVTWKQYRLMPESKCNIRFYISSGSVGEEAADTQCPFFTSEMAQKNYLAYKEAENFINVEAVEYAVLTSHDANKDPVSAYKEDKEKMEENAALNQTNIPKEKLNQEYIDSLLRQIEEVQNHPDKYSQERINQLNLELDTILRILGQ